MVRETERATVVRADNGGRAFECDDLAPHTVDRDRLADAELHLFPRARLTRVPTRPLLAAQRNAEDRASGTRMVSRIA